MKGRVEALRKGLSVKHIGQYRTSTVTDWTGEGWKCWNRIANPSNHYEADRDSVGNTRGMYVSIIDEEEISMINLIRSAMG
ncbi:MAG TPA: hypothetical protein DCP92_01260 [Nitrospiraceae bacterium]|jgi:hypothetical protein|nr:hypothetical protein [Nitrospiraceae bacterium]